MGTDQLPISNFSDHQTVSLAWNMFEKHDSGCSPGYKNRGVVEMGRTQTAHGMLMLCLLKTEKTRLLQLAKLRMSKKNGGEKKDANKEANHPPINSTQPSFDEGKMSFNRD